MAACQRCGLVRDVNDSRPTNGCKDCQGLHRKPLGDWTLHAACTHPQYNVNWWYADSQYVAERRTAINICHECPVQQTCLQVALDNNEVWGIWGGTTVDERAKMRRAQRRAV